MVQRSWFSSSPKRKNILSEVCKKKGLLRTVETRWNFKSRVLQSVLENKDNLIQVFELIKIEKWDDITTREAIGLLSTLMDNEFNYFLELFYKIFKHVDIFYNVLQFRDCTGAYVTDKINKFTSSVNLIRIDMNASDTDQNIPSSSKRIRTFRFSLNLIGIEVCDIITNQILTRFSKYELIYAFDIVNQKRFFLIEVIFLQKIAIFYINTTILSISYF